MQNQDNSQIDINFIPMQIPEVKGRYAIERLRENVYPVYAAPIKKGVELIIREGHPFINSYPFVILNTQFRERFKTFLQLTHKRNFTLHAILASPTLSNEQIIKVLISAEKLLPVDVQIHVIMVLYEKSITEMLFKNTVELIKGIFGTSELPFLPNIIPSVYTEIKTKSHLSEYTNFYLNTVRGNESILLLQKYGNYKQGTLAIEDTDAVKITPTEEIWGIVSKIESSTKFLPGETLQMADRLIIQFGETGLPFKLSNESLAYRGILHDIKEQLIGAKVLCENLYLPGANKTLIKKLLRINFN